MKYQSFSALLEALTEKNKTLKESTLNTYTREVVRVLQQCYQQYNPYDLSVLSDTDKFNDWLSGDIGVTRRDNIANSVYKVTTMLEMDELSETYKNVLKSVKTQYGNQKALALTKMTKKQETNWIKYDKIKESRDTFHTTFSAKKFAKGRGKTSFFNAMILALFVNDEWVLRPGELREMKIVDDGESNFFDITNKQMIIRNHKNDRNGTRTIRDVPDIVIKYVTLFHTRFPNNEYLLPSNKGGAIGANRFSQKIKKLIGVMPQLLRTIFVSEICSQMEDKKRIQTCEEMGHTYNTSRMIYQKE